MKKQSEKNLEMIGLRIAVPQNFEFYMGLLWGKKPKKVFCNLSLLDALYFKIEYIIVIYAQKRI